jgi:protein-tyrosine phosphatase
VDLGVRTVVATPHVHHDYPANDAESIARGVAELRRALASEGIPLDVVPGAEVALTRAMELPDDELTALHLGGGPWLLVEPPFASATSSSVSEALFRLQTRGHRLVLAHPERCSVFQRDPELLGQCVERGMLASLTAGALIGRFGRQVQRIAVDMMRGGVVHDVASDAHGADRRRPPGLTRELGEAGFLDHADRLCRETPQAILDGTAIPEPPAFAAPRGLLGRLLRRG